MSSNCKPNTKRNDTVRRRDDARANDPARAQQSKHCQRRWEQVDDDGGIPEWPYGRLVRP